MALYVLVFLGGTPVGAPVVGALAQALGPRAALVLCGVTTLVAVVAAVVWTLRTRALRLEPHLRRRRPHVHVRVSSEPAARSSAV
ncbi:MAG: MFS transporter, partial [Actinomycetes bacterium]